MARDCRGALAAAQSEIAELKGRNEYLTSTIAQMTRVTGLDPDGPCPICGGIEGCDHSLSERWSASPAQAEIARQREVIETRHSEYSALEAALWRRVQNENHCDVAECVDRHGGHCFCQQDYDLALKGKP